MNPSPFHLIFLVLFLVLVLPLTDGTVPIASNSTSPLRGALLYPYFGESSSGWTALASPASKPDSNSTISFVSQTSKLSNWDTDILMLESTDKPTSVSRLTPPSSSWSRPSRPNVEVHHLVTPDARQGNSTSQSQSESRPGKAYHTEYNYGGHQSEEPENPESGEENESENEEMTKVEEEPPTSHQEDGPSMVPKHRSQPQTAHAYNEPSSEHSDYSPYGSQQLDPETLQKMMRPSLQADLLDGEIEQITNELIYGYDKQLSGSPINQYIRQWTDQSKKMAHKTPSFSFDFQSPNSGLGYSSQKTTGTLPAVSLPIPHHPTSVYRSLVPSFTRNSRHPIMFGSPTEYAPEYLLPSQTSKSSRGYLSGLLSLSDPKRDPQQLPQPPPGYKVVPTAESAHYYVNTASSKLGKQFSRLRSGVRRIFRQPEVLYAPQEVQFDPFLPTIVSPHPHSYLAPTYKLKASFRKQQRLAAKYPLEPLFSFDTPTSEPVAFSHLKPQHADPSAAAFSERSSATRNSTARFSTNHFNDYQVNKNQPPLTTPASPTTTTSTDPSTTLSPLMSLGAPIEYTKAFGYVKPKETPVFISLLPENNGQFSNTEKTNQSPQKNSVEEPFRPMPLRPKLKAPNSNRLEKISESTKNPS